MIDYQRALAAFRDAGVDFIIIGGAAATAHGSARLTNDLDVVYARSPGNIERLAAALADHHPYLRGAPPGLPFHFDVRTIRAGLNFTLDTDLGPIDLLGEATGGGTFDALKTHTCSIEIFGNQHLCVDLPTLIHLKRAAGRPKDLEAIAELDAILSKVGAG